MWPIATDVARSAVCVSVCMLGTAASCAKVAEPMEMPVGGRLVWPQGTMYQIGEGRVNIHLAKTTPEQPVRGSDAALCQITLTTCSFSITTSITLRFRPLASAMLSRRASATTHWAPVNLHHAN